MSDQLLPVLAQHSICVWDKCYLGNLCWDNKENVSQILGYGNTTYDLQNY